MYGSGTCSRAAAKNQSGVEQGVHISSYGSGTVKEYNNTSGVSTVFLTAACLWDCTMPGAALLLVGIQQINPAAFPAPLSAQSSPPLMVDAITPLLPPPHRGTQCTYQDPHLPEHRQGKDWELPQYKFYFQKIMKITIILMKIKK